MSVGTCRCCTILMVRSKADNESVLFGLMCWSGLKLCELEKSEKATRAQLKFVQTFPSEAFLSQRHPASFLRSAGAF